MDVGLLTAAGLDKKIKIHLNGFLEVEYNPGLTTSFSNRRTERRNTLVAINTGIRWNR
jgi:hypothetical protein